MRNKIALEKMCAFAVEMKPLRLRFPELAKEIDRCLYDAGRNHIPCCGDGGCECQQTFEQFHDAQNRAFRTGKYSYEFN